MSRHNRQATILSKAKQEPASSIATSLLFTPHCCRLQEKLVDTGNDSASAQIVLAEPDFDRPEHMTNILADAFAAFTADMLALVGKIG